jgi:OmpA family
MRERYALELELRLLDREVPFASVSRPADLVIDRFAFDRSELTVAHNVPLENFAQRLVQVARVPWNWVSVSLVGHTDGIGAEAYNEKLGLKRAESAKQRLLFHLGFLNPALLPRISLTTSSKGEREPVSFEKSAAARAQNRRVELFLTQGILQLPPPVPPEPPVSPLPPQPPKPPATPSTTTSRRFALQPELTWKSKEYVYPSKGHFLRYFKAVAQAEVSVGACEATDAQMAVVKPKWVKSQGKPGAPGIEVEASFSEWFIPDVKVEGDTREGLKVSFKKTITVPGGVKLSPHVSLSEDVLSLEVESPELSIRHPLFGVQLKLYCQPKMTVSLRVDWREILKRKIKDIGPRLISDLLKFLGRAAAGHVARLLLAKLVGSALAALLFDSATTVPPSSSPNNVAGKDQALKALTHLNDAAARLQKWAQRYRQSFATGYADMLRELLGPNWRARRAHIERLTTPGYQLPALNAPTPAWQGWASTAKALQVVSLPPLAEAHRHFRWYEIALMFAVAAYLLRKLSKSEFDGVVNVCMNQATLAGASLALGALKKGIADNSYSFDTLHPSRSTDLGEKQWQAVTEIVKQAGLTPDDIRRRLSALALSELPEVP